MSGASVSGTTNLLYSQGSNNHGYGNTSYQGQENNSYERKFGDMDVFTASKHIPVNYGNSAMGASFLG